MVIFFVSVFQCCRRRPNAFEEQLVTKRLVKNATALACIAVDEIRCLGLMKMNGMDQSAAARMALELQSAHARHLCINHETGRSVELTRLQDCLGRFKNCRSISKNLDKEFCSPPNGLIIMTSA